MFECSSERLIITFINGNQAVISMRRPRDRYIQAEFLTPGGSVKDAGHYSAETLVEMLNRTAQEMSGWTPEELAQLTQSSPDRNPAYDGPMGIFEGYGEYDDQDKPKQE